VHFKRRSFTFVWAVGLIELADKGFKGMLPYSVFVLFGHGWNAAVWLLTPLGLKRPNAQLLAAVF